jgi:hypothetical protein
MAPGSATYKGPVEEDISRFSSAKELGHHISPSNHKEIKTVPIFAVYSYAQGIRLVSAIVNTFFIAVLGICDANIFYCLLLCHEI